MIRLFQKTVHEVCKKDYSPEQLKAWAPESIEAALWEKRFLSSYTLVAVEDNRILGFANLESSGNIDMFYTAADTQGKGVGKFLFSEILKVAYDRKLKKLTSDVSLTAKPFFLSRGFEVDEVYQKERAGVVFTNTLMSKKL